MDRYIPQLADAIYSRKSRRKYLDKPLEICHIQKLADFIKKMDVPFENNVEVTIHNAPANRPYLPFKGPDYFAAFKAGNTLVDQGKTGFIGELFILFAESLGIGTCWYGHYRKDNTYDIVYGISKDKAPKTIYSITPLGYVSEKMTGISDRITNLIWSNRRKSIDENFSNDSLRDFPDHVRKALNLASLAPSAMNSQPWYFKVLTENGKYAVELGKTYGYKHFKWAYPDIDVGTSAAHFWIGLQNQGIPSTIEFVEEKTRIIWKFVL